ncbi:hypothetical protein NKG94_16280 [Micromonospora sp. M12]
MMGATADHIVETSTTLGLDLALPWPCEHIIGMPSRMGTAATTGPASSTASVSHRSADLRASQQLLGWLASSRPSHDGDS